MESLKHCFEVVRSACAPYLSHIPREKALMTVAVLIVFAGYLFTIAAPFDFVPGTIVRIPHTASAPEIAQDLADAHVISHPTLLRAILRLTGESGNVQTGMYRFNTAQNIFTVAYRIVVGDYGLPSVRITFVEGFTIREAAAQVAAALPGISESDFLAAAQGQEGYLFPDTYFFQPSMDTASIVETMRTNFDRKIASLSTQIHASGHSLSDIVTMASIVEREARSTDARQMVAGILWNRIAHGMPLQVDAVFGYIFGRTTYSPSFTDLKVDSLYNTYTHKGLPPGPIANPGLDSLEAAANPTKTNYLYYLTGRDGQMHYATTYAQHQANQRKYLQ